VEALLNILDSFQAGWKEKKYVQFPFPMWVSSKIIKFMPNFLYEPIAARIKK